MVGVFNAAVWLGSAVFFTFALTSGIFSEEFKRVFGGYYTGIVAQTLIGRYFVVHLVCAIIALVHFFAEMAYAGRPFRRIMFGCLLGVLALGLIGGQFFAPRLNRLHEAKYRGSPDQKAAAQQQFSRLHALSRIADVLGLLVIVAYTWQVANPPDQTRFVSAQKFRG